MRDTGEPHAGDVPRRGVHALEIPDGLGRLRFEIGGKQATSVLELKDAGVAPGHLGERLDVEDLDEQGVAGLSAFDCDWTGQVVYTVKVDVFSQFN